MTETKRKRKKGDPVLVTIDGSQVEGAFVRLTGIQKTGSDGKKHRSSVLVEIGGKQKNYPYEDVQFVPVVDQPAAECAIPIFDKLNEQLARLDAAQRLTPAETQELLETESARIAAAMEERNRRYIPPHADDLTQDWLQRHHAAEEPEEHVWVNELQSAYVMVDSDGVIFTYEVEADIESLEDLQDLMQIKGWRLAADAVEPRTRMPNPDLTIAEAIYMIKTTGMIALPLTTSDKMEGVEMSPEMKTAADANVGDCIWHHMMGAEKHYALVDEVHPDKIVFGNGYSLAMSHFGINWGFANPYKPAGEEIAAEPPVDAPNALDAAEEPETPKPSHMLALRWDTEILGEEKLPYRIWGIQFLGGSRYRVVETPGGSIDFAPGPTSVLKVVMPKAQMLTDWQINTFRDTKELAAYMALKTGYGSVVHGAFADALNGITAKWEDRQWWLDYLKAACARNGAKGMEALWLMDVQKSLMSIRQWAIDYKVRFLFVEKALYAPRLGVCGQIDMLVEMDSHIQNVKSTVKAKQAEPTRVLALVDIKTGKDSDQYPAQLAMYREMLLEGLPQIKDIMAQHYPSQIVDGHYNIPCYLLFPESGWRKAPKAARMLDRTEKAAEYAQIQMGHHIALFKAQRRQPSTKTVLSGPSGFDFTNEGAVGFKTLADVWMEKIQQGDLDPIEDIETEEDSE